MTKELERELLVEKRTREITAQKAEGLERRAHRDLAEAKELNESVNAMTIKVDALEKEITKLEKKERKETA